MGSSSEADAAGLLGGRGDEESEEIVRGHLRESMEEDRRTSEEAVAAPAGAWGHQQGVAAPAPAIRVSDASSADLAPKKKAAVLFKGPSFHSVAPSQATSASSNSAYSQAMLGTLDGKGLGLAKLNRPEWTMEELTKRSKVIPVLKESLGQIDGTVKAKFSHFSKPTSPAENLEKFGHAFYAELFETAPELKTTLFKDKPLELLAIKLASIMGELIRLLEIQSPQALAGEIAVMGLKHIDYGLKAEHQQPFRTAMVKTIKKVIQSKGHKWHHKTSNAWNWGLNEIINYLVEATEVGRPKIELLNRSWAFMCEKLYEEMCARNKRQSVSLHRNSVDAGPSGAARPQRQSLDAGRRQSVDVHKKWKSAGAKIMVTRMFNKSKAPSGAAGPVEDMEYPMWSKKINSSDNIVEYVEGRDAVGKAFCDLFAASNAWAVRDFDFGLNPEHAKKMGLALELIVSSATKPQVLQHKLRVLALGHVQMGIKPEMFHHFERALFQFLEQVLGDHHKYDKKTEGAWRWMWDIVNAAFTRHMNSAAQNLGTLLKSWKYIEACHDIGDISDKFFALLFHRAPGLQAMFVKPKKMQTVMFSKAMNLIIKSVEDTKVLEVELKAIALRHIKYDINQEHLSIFGEVLISTLSDLSGVEQWDEDIETAWADIYGHIAQVFGHVISTGRNLVSKAMASGSTAELEAALTLTPRSRRVLAALEIEVDDTSVSPVVWTINEGQLKLTDTLLRDILAIRGDRDSYYYGRQILWAKHPWILRLLVERAPRLVPAFLDGHLWTSRFMEDGHRRVNYYIKELYGDPYLEENYNVHNTAVGLFTDKLPASEMKNFSHPTMDFVINLKWYSFARRDFLLGQVLNFCSLAMNTIFMQTGADAPVMSFTLALCQLLAAGLRLAAYVGTVTKQISQGNGHTVRWPRLRIKLFVPYLFTNMFLILNIITSIFIAVLFYMTYVADPFHWQEALNLGEEEPDDHLLEIWADVAAFTTGLLWIQMGEIFMATNKLSALLFAMATIIKDVARFVLIMGVWAMGFSVLLFWLFVGTNLKKGYEIHDALHVDLGLDDDANIGMLIYYIITSFLGLTGVEVIMNANWIIRAMYAACVLFTVVVLLNLLVSTMVSTYEHLQRGFNELALKSRAQLVLRSEEGSSVSRRIKFFDRLGFEDRLEFDPGDDGPAGGIQRLVPAQELTHQAFTVLDRIERYGGSSKPDTPWDPEELITSAVISTTMFGQGTKSSANRKLLDSITTDLERLSTDLFILKRGVTNADDAGSQAASSVQSGDSNLSKQMVEASGADDEEGDDAMFDPIAPPEAEEQETSSRGPEADPDSAANVVTYQDLADHSSASSLWLSIGGKVHDVTHLLGFHPGGKDILLASAGKDCTVEFYDSHQGPSRTAAVALMKAMPFMGLFDSATHAAPSVAVTPAVPPLPLGSITPVGSARASAEEPRQAMAADSDDLPLYTPRDIDLDMNI